MNKSVKTWLIFNQLRVTSKRKLMTSIKTNRKMTRVISSSTFNTLAHMARPCQGPKSIQIKTSMWLIAAVYLYLEGHPNNLLKEVVRHWLIQWLMSCIIVLKVWGIKENNSRRIKFNLMSNIKIRLSMRIQKLREL